MSKEKVMEKEEILQVMEKYKDYFNEWDADVAFGVNGKNIFYVLASRREFETFLFFRTADQLEKIILGTVAENLDVILGAGIDEVNVGFSAEDVDEKSDKSNRALSASACTEAGYPLQGGGELVPHAAGDIQLHKECLCGYGRQGEGIDFLFRKNL